MTMTPKDIINNHRQKGEWNEIIPIAQEILSKDPGDLAALRSLAEACERIDQVDQAMAIWRILVDRHHEEGIRMPSSIWIRP
ncbi:MAG: tetratricopeptide repeat protein [Candidatus Omnitrophica bacterium]|nr:tetratricopeptide repeat protein [Candidatus Omnitrophota bacterium]